MAEVLTKQETINEIVKEARKLDKLELQILLTRLRVKKMKKDGVKPAANPAKGVRPPSMEEINTTKNPSYEDVCTRSTGHAESVQVYYNPTIISFATLAESFFYAHDPTTLNRQGADEGTDYRSIAFYRSPDEKKTLEQVIAKVNQGHHYKDPIVTQVLPFKVLYPAENYHQGYYRLHMDNPYIQNVSVPKVMKLRKVMNSQLKPEFHNMNNVSN